MVDRWTQQHSGTCITGAYCGRPAIWVASDRGSLSRVCSAHKQGWSAHDPNILAPTVFEADLMTIEEEWLPV